MRLAPNILKVIVGTILTVAASVSSHAGVIITITQVGSDVVATSSGSISSKSGLTLASAGLTNGALINSTQSRILLGSDGAFDIYNGLSVTGSLGTGVLTSASASTGLKIGMNGGGSSLWLSSAYSLNASFQSTATWTNKTLADLGLTAGSTVTATWNSGGESLQLKVLASPPAPVPEPTSLAIFGLGAIGLAYRNRRKQKA